MKKIRIILINNLTTALFMAAYYHQENKKNNNYRNICFIHWYNIRENNTELERAINTIHIEVCKKLAEKITTEIIVCQGRVTENIGYSFINAYRAKRDRAYYLNVINGVFKQNEIDPKMIVEVYHGNGILHQYIKYLAPKTKLVGFEHGIHELRCYFHKLELVFNLKDIIKTVLGRLFFIFYPYSENDNFTVSLFATRVKNFNKHICVEEVRPGNVNKIADDIAIDDLIDRNLLNNYRRSGIILLTEAYDLADNKEEYLNFSRSFLEFISDRIKKETPQINTIIFKPKYHNKYFYDIKMIYREYFRDYSIFPY